MALTIAELKVISGLSDIKQHDTDSVLQYWIDLSEALISTYNLNDSLPGYEINIKFATAKTAEFLFLQNQEEYIVQVNNPYQSERIGSFAYTKRKRVEGRPDLDGLLPEIAIAIIARYLIITSSASALITTRVFREGEPVDSDDILERQYSDYLSSYNMSEYNVLGSYRN